MHVLEYLEDNLSVTFVDAYGKVAPLEFRQQDRTREREEFERSGKFFKDLSGVMASRFTRSKQTDEDNDSKVSISTCSVPKNLAPAAPSHICIVL